MALKALKPERVIPPPLAFGEHIRQVRRSRGLTQDAVAEAMGVCADTVVNWETGKTAAPPIGTWPAILQFLGYDPFPEPVTLAERLCAKRRIMGWSIKKAARQLGVDEETWGGWEMGAVPWDRNRPILEAFLDGDQ